MFLIILSFLAISLNKEKTEMFTEMFGNTVLVDYQPTCENLVSDFAERIAPHLPEGVKLHSLKLYETATSFAEWFAAIMNTVREMPLKWE